jgi:hypothetical protein
MKLDGLIGSQGTKPEDTVKHAMGTKGQTVEEAIANKYSFKVASNRKHGRSDSCRQDRYLLDWIHGVLDTSKEMYTHHMRRSKKPTIIQPKFSKRMACKNSIS